MQSAEMRGSVGEPELYCSLICEEELRPCTPRIGHKRGLAITLARAIIASPHSHEDASSWY